MPFIIHFLGHKHQHNINPETFQCDCQQNLVHEVIFNKTILAGVEIMRYVFNVDDVVESFLSYSVSWISW